MDGLLQTLGLNFKVLIVQAITFLIVFAILSKFLFKRIGDYMHRRETEIRDRFDEIEKKTQEAERLTSEYQARLQKIEAEAQTKIQAAVKEGLKMKNEIMEQAQAEAVKERERVKQEIQIEKEKAILEIRQHVIRLTIDATQRLLGDVVSPEVHGKLVQKYLDELDKVYRLQ